MSRFTWLNPVALLIVLCGCKTVDADGGGYRAQARYGDISYCENHAAQRSQSEAIEHYRRCELSAQAAGDTAAAEDCACRAACAAGAESCALKACASVLADCTWYKPR
jgi:hypothetical protein